jgi:hypothetical protein
VPEKHDVVEVLKFDEVHHVGDVGLQVHFGRGEVHALAETSEGNRISIVAVISQLTGYGLPAPASEPSATYQHVSCHPQDLLVVYGAPNARILQPLL